MKKPTRQPAKNAANETETETKTEAKNKAALEPTAAEPPAPRETPADETADKTEAPFLIAGVGASAGGLDALGELFRHVRVGNVSFIVVQHLVPDHESVLTQLLGRCTPMPVVTATEGTVLEPHRVYVIPPNAELAVMHGTIRLLTPANAHGPRLPIDYLFRSLAQDQGPAAVGIVLSGTGTDGTHGLEAIKAAGGFTFVQEPSTAKYDGMPRSALASGAADYCLPPKEIAAEVARLARLARGAHVRQVDRTAQPPVRVQEQLAKLFVLIRSEFGNDLTQYKPATIDRRIERRMVLHKLERLEDYVKYVQQNRDELTALYQDMLITVTCFFRDPDAFEALKATVLKQLVEHKEATQPIRVWVPGCATGEEAYSIAMCLLEVCEEKIPDVRIQIFGTDVDDEAIQYARRGVYAANISADVSPERLNRFFVKRDNEYAVARRIRDMLVFSKQNILKDAPFSRMDLVSCRNLLIYLQSPAQKKVLRTFHYALNPAGYLFLGTSETVGDAPELFSPVDRKSKIYVRKHVAAHVAPDMGFGLPATQEPIRERATVRPTLSLQGLADRKVLELYGPAGVVVNESLEILQFRGRTGRYLEPAPGTASLNILKVARFELHVELKKAIQQAIDQRLRVTTDVPYQDDGKHSRVTIDVVPLQDPESNGRCFLVLFQATAPSKDLSVAVSTAGATADQPDRLAQRIQELDRELATTREYLQTTIEDRESTLEELKSANEELQSANEELQSTNEELETSKEEMQSTNEELTTVNEELQNRMRELSQTNDDLHNVLSGVDNAVVIVGMDLKIRRFTGAAERLFHLVAGDIGRSIGFLDTFIGASAGLEAKVSAAIQNLSTLDEELLAANQRWYGLRVSPYKTLDHTIRGALVTLTDVDVRKRAQEMTRDVGAYADKFLAAIGHPLLIVDRKLRVAWANGAFLSTFQVAADETVGSPLPSVGNRQFADPKLRERIDAVFASSSMFRGQEMRIQIGERGERLVRVGGSLIPASPETLLALVSIEPVGEASVREVP